MDKKQVDKRREEVEYNKTCNDLDLTTVLSTANGRRFLWNLLAKCRVFHSCYTGNNDTFYNEGRRDVGLEILDNIMRVDADAFATMQRECYSNKINKDI